LTLSLVPILVQQIYRVTGLAMQVNYGVDKLRFPAPVPVDSRIRAGAELLKVERNESGGRATVRVTVEVEGSDRPACVVDTIAAMVDA
jgi:acyl dehydratase